MISPATSRTWRDRPGGRRQLARVQRLHRVDHAHLGLARARASPARRRRSVSAITGTAQGVAAAQPLGAQTDLRRPTPRRDVQRAAARRRRLAERHVVSVDLPIPGAPPISTSEPGTMPPPRTSSSSPIPVLSRSWLDRLDVPERRSALTAAAARARPAPATPPRPRRRRGSARRACSTPRTPGTDPPSGPTRGRRPSRRGRRTGGP